MDFLIKGAMAAAVNMIILQIILKNINVLFEFFDQIDWHLPTHFL